MESPLQCSPQSDWEVKSYKGIKSYAPSKGSVPSDVSPGVYEGGFQLWECSLDLIDFLNAYPNFNGKSVFELGCGRGLPGILTALKGASKVVLQDFNRDVIEKLTMPNVALNGCESNVVFSASDWKDIPHLFGKGEYDIILASETIYRKEDLSVFVSACRHLVKDDGIIIVAAKRMYFGLSGSVFDLIELVKDEYTYELKEIKDHSAYKRDIIVLHRPQ